MAVDKAQRFCARDGCNKSARVKWCSERCRIKASRAHVEFTERNCDNCGKRFMPTRVSQRFCPGGACATAYHNTAKNLAGIGGTKVKKLKMLDQLLTSKGIDLDDLEAAQIKSVKFWQSSYKDAAGEGQVQDLAGIQISPAWETGPKWPVIQPGPQIALSVSRSEKTTKKRSDNWLTAVVLPDIQAGYYRDAKDELTPTHDERALSIALQVVRDTSPDVIVMHGDNADFPEFGRYRLTPTFQRTTQATIDRLTTLCAELREAAPAAAIEWLAGNHEERLPNYIIDNARAAFGLKRGMTPASWPVLSVPHLCRFDEYGVTFHPGYPANEYWINDRLRVIHGAKVNSRGSTAPRYLDAERVSTLYGHVHRREWAERTRHTREGPRTVLAASAGCLAKIDGSVPSTKGGVDLDGQPLTSTEQWQQGIAVVQYQPGDGMFWLELVSIFDGISRYRGKDFTA